MATGSGRNTPGADHKGQHLHPCYVAHAALLRNVNFATLASTYPARRDLHPYIRSGRSNGFAGHPRAFFQNGRTSAGTVRPGIRRQGIPLLLGISGSGPVRTFMLQRKVYVDPVRYPDVLPDDRIQKILVIYSLPATFQVLPFPRRRL